MAYPSFLRITPISNDTGAATPTLPIYAIRGIRQTLSLITGTKGGEGSLGTTIRRSINGTLIDGSAPQFRKYESIIAFDDTVMPAFDDAWIGVTCLVDCACELGYPVSSPGPARNPVSGSEREEAGFNFYRPQLIMMVYDFNSDFDEWGANYKSSLKLQEV